MRRLGPVFCVFLASCGCRSSGLVELEPARLRVSPARVGLPETYVGQQSSAVVEITNAGGQPAFIDASVGDPFAVAEGHLGVPAGESRTLVVSFAPGEARRFEAVID